MREDVKELIRRIQSANRTHDIRSFSSVFQKEVDKISKDCDYDFKGELANNLKWLLDATNE